MTKTIITGQNSLWITSIPTVLVSGFFGIVNLGEWLKVGILKQTDGYPFGSEGPAPYFYQTSNLYSTVVLTWGILFLLTLTFWIIVIVKKQRKALVLSFAWTLFLVAMMFIHGQIGLD